MITVLCCYSVANTIIVICVDIIVLILW